MMHEKPDVHTTRGRRDSGHAPPVLLRATANYALAHFDDLFVVMWRAATTVEGANDLRTECEKFAATHPDGIGLIVTIDVRSPLPTKPVRQAIAEFMKIGSSYIKASSVIFEGNALQSSAVRSVATGLAMLARQVYPQKFFSDVHQAMAYLEKSLRPLAPGPNANEMFKGLENVRRLVAQWDSSLH